MMRRCVDFMGGHHRPGYLRRWVVADCRAGGIWVHRFEGSDPRRELHNHPRSFISIVAKGPGYIEQRGCGGYHHVRRFSLKRAQTDWHRVSDLMGGPTWTVLILGPKRGRSWATGPVGGQA